jgi:hypothetical protein
MTARYQVHHFLFRAEKNGENLGIRLKKMIGNRIIAIQRRSYRMPSQNDGSRSPKERSLGLKAKNVASLNKVKMSKKIKKRFTTHRMVLGIFSLISIMLRPEECSLTRSEKEPQKKVFSSVPTMISC